MSEKLISAKIIVEELKLENGRYAIKAGGKTYSFFQFKRDQSESKAFETFKELAVQIGSEVGILYDETPNPQGGGPYRNIKVFKDPQEVIEVTQGQPPQAPKQPQIEEKPSQEVWQGINRMNMAQAAINASANVHQGSQVGSNVIIKTADKLYEYIESKKNGGNTSNEVEYEEPVDTAKEFAPPF